MVVVQEKEIGVRFEEQTWQARDGRMSRRGMNSRSGLCGCGG